MRAMAACSREGACPSARRLGTGEFRSARVGERAAVRRGSVGRVGQALPARRHGGSLCSEETRAPERGCETERAVSVRLALFASSQNASCP